MTMLRMLAFKRGAPGARVEAMAVPAPTKTPAPVSARVSTAISANAPPNKEFQAAPVSAAATAFSGDWPQFVAQQNLSGMASMLAKQCEFKSFQGGVLELAVAEQHKHLAAKPYQDKLKVALQPHFGENLRLNISIGQVAGVSLAAHEDRARSRQQAEAEAAIDADPFIKSLQQDFGAEIERSAIRPAQPT
jgi:DNA polymerase-3 subunit gamma/tau